MSETQEGVLRIWVKSRASRNEILGFRDGYLWIRVKAAPIGGEANRLCCQVLAEVLGIAPSKVIILAGQQSRRKRVRIEGIDSDFLNRWLSVQISRECFD